MADPKMDAPKASQTKPLDTKPLDTKQPDTKAAVVDNPRKSAEPEAVKFEPKLESKDDHVAHIAAIARKMQETQPSAVTFARDILHHVAAIQDPGSYNATVAAEQKAAFEADALSAKQRGRAPEDKAKVV